MNIEAMMDEPIITTLMDTDKYKFSMQQINLHRYPKAHGKYRFKCRNQGVDLSAIVPVVRRQLDMVAGLNFQDSELRYLAGEPHLSEDYIDYLRNFQLSARHVHIHANGSELDIIADGPMLQASPWELYILPIVNEVYFAQTVPEPDYDEGRRRLQDKITLLKTTEELEGFNFAEFGSRRRFSKDWQEEVIRTLKLDVPTIFSGTSNYHFAKEYDLIPIGTMAHEYLQAWQGMVHPLDALKVALDNWADEFRGGLGDALTDVVGMDVFCQVLDPFLAKQFDGFRQDSGCAYAWCEKLLARLKELDVDPKTKRAIWSDGLDIPTCIDLFKTFNSRIKTGFGVGTNLTNDLGYTPLNIVMKLVELNGRPVAKIPDSQGKSMCEDALFVRWFATALGRDQEVL